MIDPRMTQLAEVLIHYSTELKPGEKILIEAIDGLETIKSSAAESRVQGKWEQAVGMTAASSGQARTISTLATTFAQATRLETGFWEMGLTLSS